MGHHQRDPRHVNCSVQWNEVPCGSGHDVAFRDSRMLIAATGFLLGSTDTADASAAVVLLSGDAVVPNLLV